MRKIRKMERGTAAQNVPVRQTRVAERDDDVAVSSSDVKIGWPKSQWPQNRKNETWCVDPTKRGSNITRAETQLGVANRKHPARVLHFETAASEMAHVFSSDRRQNRKREKGSRARASHLGNLISDCSGRVSVTGARPKQSRPFSQSRLPARKSRVHRGARTTDVARHRKKPRSQDLGK